MPTPYEAIGSMFAAVVFGIAFLAGAQRLHLSGQPLMAVRVIGALFLAYSGVVVALALYSVVFVPPD